jgi:hypothetical protein
MHPYARAKTNAALESFLIAGRSMIRQHHIGESCTRLRIHMNIENFVLHTLEQLGSAIVKAHDKPGINVSPRPYMRDDPSNTAGGHLVDSTSSDCLIVFIEFDLSVVVRSQIGGEAQAKLEVEVLGLDMGGGKIDGSLDHTRVQRVKFQIPVSFDAANTRLPSSSPQRSTRL